MDIHALECTLRNNHNNTSFHSSVSFFCVVTFLSKDFMWAAEGAALVGAAKRRRERRHRAYLKYVRMSVAMALSEYKHHTSRGQRMDRAGRWERAALHGTFRSIPPPRRQALRTSKMCLPPGRGLTASLASGRSGRFSGSLWSRLSTLRCS